MLDSLRGRVDEAACGEDALAAILNPGTLDAAILAVTLRPPSGLRVLALARAAGVRIPVVLMARDPDSDLRATAEELGNTEVLVMPFAEVELLAALERLRDRAADPEWPPRPATPR
jgi:DNA-binding response OmpR family regulator